MKHYSIRVTGKVQNVWFRDSTKKEADRLGVKGIVRNEPDGSVYIEAEGDANVLEQFIKWCKQGPELAKVDQLHIHESDMKGYKDFQITHLV